MNLVSIQNGTNFGYRNKKENSEIIHFSCSIVPVVPLWKQKKLDAMIVLYCEMPQTKEFEMHRQIIYVTSTKKLIYNYGTKNRTTNSI